MLDSFLHTHTCALLILEEADRERERAGLLLDVGERLTRSFELELVRDIGRSLVNGRARFLRFDLQQVRL